MRLARLCTRYAPVVGMWSLVACGPETDNAASTAAGDSTPPSVVANASSPFAPTQVTPDPAKCRPGVAGNGRTHTIPANKSRQLHLPGSGRNHTLWVFASPVARRITFAEVSEDSVSGVRIIVEPAGEPDEPWAYLQLAANDCEIPADQGAAIVNVDTNEAPVGGYDTMSNYAFAILTENSTYILSTPVGLEFELDAEAPPAP